MVDVDIRISIHLKEKLACAVDKRLWVISNLKIVSTAEIIINTE